MLSVRGISATPNGTLDAGASLAAMSSMHTGVGIRARLYEDLERRCQGTFRYLDDSCWRKMELLDSGARRVKEREKTGSLEAYIGVA